MARATTEFEDGCPLCKEDDARLIWRDARLRVIVADETDYPGFCRVIWHAHAREMSDLDATERGHLWRVLQIVETGLRDILVPDKINLASFGNVVAHLHWHVIPRWHDDRTFPNPIWGSPRLVEQDAQRPAVWLERSARAERLFASLPQLLDTAFPWRSPASDAPTT